MSWGTVMSDVVASSVVSIVSQTMASPCFPQDGLTRFPLSPHPADIRVATSAPLMAFVIEVNAREGSDVIFFLSLRPEWSRSKVVGFMVVLVNVVTCCL